MRTLKLGSTGSDVMKIQAALEKIGYDPGVIDGKYSEVTQKAVMELQIDNGLSVDGIFGPNTYEALSPCLFGYGQYTIQPGDTLWKIANQYATTIDKILIANPDINPYNLQVGQEIIVPYNIDVVDTNIGYTYEIMDLDIFAIKARYPFLEVGVAGKSVLGRNLYYFKLGTGPNQVFYNASQHANEWITTPVLMKFTENYLKHYIERKPLRGYDLEELWNESTIYIMPMVNPDCVNLVIDGLLPDNPYYDNLSNFIDEGFDSWKSNIRGVDLNRNYSAKWEDYVELSKELGLNQPGPRGYAGPFPESEPESKTVADFTRLHDLRLVLAYHTQGEVIFWKFEDLEPPESLTIGEAFAQVSGYELADVYESASLAGYKDWFIQDYRKPGYTIEAGKGQNPLPISEFPIIYEDNEELLLLAAVI